MFFFFQAEDGIRDDLVTGVQTCALDLEFRCPRVAGAIGVLRQLPGRRMFQYRDEAGAVRIVTASDVNEFLREIADVKISLKDIRTLSASAAALEVLAHIEPAASERGRRRQVRDACITVSEHLLNTPTIVRKSYVHATVGAACETGALPRGSEPLQGSRPPAS